MSEEYIKIEIDKLDFIGFNSWKQPFNYQILVVLNQNPLLDDLTEMYSNIMNAAADR